MSETAAARGRISRLVYGTAGAHISLVQGEIRIAAEPVPRRIAVASLTQPARADRGPIWSTLALETASGTLELKGYRAAELGGIADLINASLRQEASARIEARHRPMRRLLDELDALDAYLRDSRRCAYVVWARAVLGDAGDRLWEAYATATQREDRERLQRWCDDSLRLTYEWNQRFAVHQMAEFAQLFDTVESTPLTSAQRFAAVRDEDSNLVLAGAGTGKTSTMIGRAAYLVASGAATAEQILMIAYGNKAAREMEDRQRKRLGDRSQESTPTIRTFHALGLEIIGHVEGRRPDVSRLATDDYARSSFINNAIEINCDDPAYLEKLVRYLGTDRFIYRSPFDFESMEQYNEYVRDEELRTLRCEAVKSFEELEIANTLNAYSIEYLYEAPYEHPTYTSEFRQYKPDFYLPDYGIYIEHFALDREGRAPSHFVGYTDGVDWKREVHRNHGTTLVETFSFQKREGVLESSLLEALQQHGVRLHKRDDREMLAAMKADSVMLEFATFVGTFVTLAREAGLDVAVLRSRAADARDPRRFGLILDIAEPVLRAYEEELHARNETDFAQMIHTAVEYVESGQYCAPYTHVMIDEFQDISAPRARLARALQAQNDGTLFAVGDDWQAIYRFAGSDVRFTSDFGAIFGPSAITSLDQTFRFNDQIGRVAEAFVLRNPAQTKKEVRALRTASARAVVVLEVATDLDGLKCALSAIATRTASEGASRPRVLVLGRFGFVLDAIDRSERRKLKDACPGAEIDYVTAHAAKGKEADFVVVLGLRSGKYGFPSKKRTDEVLEALLPPAESFDFAEERRLFYVALTRARHGVYLVTDCARPSQFVTELVDDPSLFPVERVSETGAQGRSVQCPRCNAARLVRRQNDRGSFYGCGNYPYCEHLEPGCPECGTAMEKHGTVRVCTNPQCDRLSPVCPVCGSHMKMRTGRNGSFWGCVNYRGEEQFSCRGTAKADAFPVKGAQWQGQS